MKNKIDPILQRLVTSTVFLSLLSLPWINSVRISTFLFIVLGVILILKKDAFKVNYTAIGKQPFFLIFIAYFALQLTAYIFYPVNLNRSAIEQKASLIFIPVLFFILISQYKNSWNIAKTGFITGNIIASSACLGLAFYKYFQSADTSVFFYHQYAQNIGLSAIYFSLYLVVALIYSVNYFQEFYRSAALKKCFLFAAIAIFLFINLILLSSKTVLVIGSLLLFMMLYKKSLFSRAQKISATALFLLFFTGILFTNNPIASRYKEIKLSTYTAVIHNNNFKDFAFDGFNLRLLLWRMGFEIGNENNSWFTGNGGKHFHHFLNNKITKYNLFTGDASTGDKGYLNYNLHNQYLESYAQFGLIGVLLVLGLIFSTIYYSTKYNNDILIYIILLFGCVFFTESVMERQAGILLLTIFISGEWILTQQKLA